MAVATHIHTYLHNVDILVGVHTYTCTCNNALFSDGMYPACNDNEHCDYST